MCMLFKTKTQRGTEHPSTLLLQKPFTLHVSYVIVNIYQYIFSLTVYKAVQPNSHYSI
jgi:hypothetical protein